MLFLAHHVLVDEIWIYGSHFNVYLSVSSHNLPFVIALAELPQQLVIDTPTMVGVGSLRVDVQDVKETTVAH